MKLFIIQINYYNIKKPIINRTNFMLTFGKIVMTASFQFLIKQGQL